MQALHKGFADRTVDERIVIEIYIMGALSQSDCLRRCISQRRYILQRSPKAVQNCALAVQMAAKQDGRAPDVMNPVKLDTEACCNPVFLSGNRTRHRLS
jgi:hypothetical protein